MPTIAQVTALAGDLVNGRPARMRSPKWSALAERVLKSHARCAVCGYARSLNVHHIRPFHLFPELELVEANLIVLGEACPGGNHHLWFGHLGNWRSWNETVERDAEHFLNLLYARPEVPYR